MTQTENKRKIAHGPTVHAIKRAKYQAKQERRQRQQQQQGSDSSPSKPSPEQWFNGREDYAVFITVDDVRIIRQLRCTRSNSAAHKVKESSDTSNYNNQCTRLDRIASWIEPFFDLKEAPTQVQNNSNYGSTVKDRLFIAEGTEPVRLLIQKSETSGGCSSVSEHDDKNVPPVQLVSILCKPAAFFEQPVCLLDEITIKYPKCISGNNSYSFKIIVGSEETLSEIVGFPVSRGAMACGVVPRFREPFQWLKRLLSMPQIDTTNNEQPTAKLESVVRKRKLLALDAISNTSNMGSILRTAAAFGIDAILMSDDSCDAWYRQSVRVSMGHVISVPTIRVSELSEGLNIGDNKCGDGGLPAALRWLRDEMKVSSFAAVVDDDSTIRDERMPPLVTLESIAGKHDACVAPSSWVCVLGNEGNGIRKEVVEHADYRIKISMANDDVDSLSLPVAAGILIHGLCFK